MKKYDRDELKNYSVDPHGGCQGHCCMPHPHARGLGLGWPSPGIWLFPEDTKHALIALSLLVPMSCSWSWSLLFFNFPLVLILVLTPCLQNHPGVKKKIIQSIEKRSDENKRNVQRLLDTHAANSSSLTNSTKIGRHQDAMDDARYGR
jgi:hypothetical protein